MRRKLRGTILALACTAVLVGAMLPLRGSLSIATTALILVVPVVIGVVTGGFAVGVVSVLAGFLVYDFFFIPPYLTLWVGAPPRNGHARDFPTRPLPARDLQLNAPHAARPSGEGR